LSRTESDARFRAACAGRPGRCRRRRDALALDVALAFVEADVRLAERPREQFRGGRPGLAAPLLDRREQARTEARSLLVRGDRDPTDEQQVAVDAGPHAAHDALAVERDAAEILLELAAHLVEGLRERRHVDRVVDERFLHEGGALEREHLAGVVHGDRSDAGGAHSFSVIRVRRPAAAGLQ